MPPPEGDPDAPLKALIFDSWYDAYRGVIVVVRVLDGTLKPGMKIRFMATAQDYEVEQLGVFTPKPVELAEIGVGEVGFIDCGIKRIADAQIGDTVTETARPTPEPLPGFKPLKPMVFAGLYPVESHAYGELRDALEKLRLNDSAFFFEPETSVALGFGFRCGFLGLLHMEIVQERLEREFDIDLITTAPGVLYRVTTTDGVVREIDSPAKLPDAGTIQLLEEPVITAMVLTPAEHVGGILQLCQDKRGVQKALEYKAADRVLITYELPFAEVVLDFYDRLKTISRGYASLDYDVTGYWASPLVKLDILVNGEPVDALSMIVHRDQAYDRGRLLVAKMRELIPRQMFEVAIQAAIGARIIARETVKAMRKNVLAKCYGGDITRKRKLLEKQKEGKKRMKRVGTVEIPQEAFLAVLKRRRNDRDHRGLPEVHRPRVLRVDRRRGDPGAVHPHLRRAGLQDPDRLDGAEPARRRSPAGQQVRVRADGQRRRAGAAAGAADRARRRRRLQVSRGARARLHQADHRPARRDHRGARAPRCWSTARRSTQPFAHFLLPHDPAAPVAKAIRASATGRSPCPTGTTSPWATTATTRRTAATGASCPRTTSRAAR